jgi:hypothetical protein
MKRGNKKFKINLPLQSIFVELGLSTLTVLVLNVSSSLAKQSLLLESCLGSTNQIVIEIQNVFLNPLVVLLMKNTSPFCLSSSLSFPQTNYHPESSLIPRSFNPRSKPLTYQSLFHTNLES